MITFVDSLPGHPFIKIYNIYNIYYAAVNVLLYKGHHCLNSSKLCFFFCVKDIYYYTAKAK